MWQLRQFNFINRGYARPAILCRIFVDINFIFILLIQDHAILCGINIDFILIVFVKRSCFFMWRFNQYIFDHCCSRLGHFMWDFSPYWFYLIVVLKGHITLCESLANTNFIFGRGYTRPRHFICNLTYIDYAFRCGHSRPYHFMANFSQYCFIFACTFLMATKIPHNLCVYESL